MYNLIIVDDEKQIRDGIANICSWEKLGFKVCGCFENGQQALSFISKNKTHVILSDIRMPVLDGIGLSKYIFENSIPVEIVFLSGYSDFDLARKAIQYKIFDYITKPVSYKDIFTVFSALYEKLNKENNIVEENIEMDNSPIINTIKKFVHKNFANATLDGAAMEVGLSPNYVSKLFKQYTNMNFSDYVILIKMQNANTMLKDVRLKIYEVSLLCGYDNPRNFAKMFKQFYGVTPQTFRKGTN